VSVRENSSQLDSNLDRIAAKLRSDSRICILTGAGLSAASGIPTFRGQEGLWEKCRPEDLARLEAFDKDPVLVWKWYAWRRECIAACQPNRAHEVLAAWSTRIQPFCLITQNVDGLHERAGTQKVIRFHGSIWELQCRNSCPNSPYRWWDDTVPFQSIPPTCPYCHGLARPGVVWFGESIDQEILTQALLGTNCDVFFSIGTSAVVTPAATLIHHAKKNGAFTVEINAEVTPISDLVDLTFHGQAAATLTQIEQRLINCL